MNTLHLLAPTSVDFAVVAGVADRDPIGYGEFWNEVNELIPRMTAVKNGTMRVQVEHSGAGEIQSRYASISSDSLTRPHHLLTLTFNQELLTSIVWPEAFKEIEEITIRLYPFWLGILEVAAQVHLPSTKRDVGTNEILDKIQSVGVKAAEELALQLFEGPFQEVLSVIHAADPRNQYVQPPMPRVAKTGKALWVSRSLIVSPRNRELLDHWTRDVEGPEGALVRRQFLHGQRNSFVRWLNYGFVDSETRGIECVRTGEHAEQFAALRYAQAQYSSLDQLDGQLKIVLADAAAATSAWELEELQDDLVRLRASAELIIMDRQELKKYLNRRVRSYFEEILEIWEYSGLVEEPALFKIDLCNRRLEDLTARRTAKASRITDLILMGIGVTSIAGTALAISEFGRSSAGNATSTGYDMGAAGFTNWFASQPIDVVLLVSASLSGILVVLYLYFLRNGRS